MHYIPLNKAHKPSKHLSSPPPPPKLGVQNPEGTNSAMVSMLSACVAGLDLIPRHSAQGQQEESDSKISCGYICQS